MVWGAWPGGWAAGTRQEPRGGGGRGGGRGEGGGWSRRQRFSAPGKASKPTESLAWLTAAQDSRVSGAATKVAEGALSRTLPSRPRRRHGCEKSNSTGSFYFSSWILPAAHEKRRQPPAFVKRGQETFSVRSGKGCQAGAAVLSVLLVAVPTPPQVPALGLTSGS